MSYSSAKKFKLIGEPEETGSFFRVRRFMEERLGSDLALSPWDGEVKLPYDTISEETREILSSAFPTMKISYDILSRFMASIGRGSTEVLLAREGLIEPVDAVLHTGYDALGDLLPSLGSRNIRAVIRGGGTGVTEGLRRRKKGILVAIDTTSLKNIEIGKNWIRVGSGWKGKELEGLLNQRGYTMGNSPY
ncbi:MAG: FAD-binding protein, partial [Candidatus Thermoplasmatota archaeon]|nr:FAD-binding protein [Candidatus Thermoplasmatota archaeon]